MIIPNFFILLINIYYKIKGNSHGCSTTNYKEKFP